MGVNDCRAIRTNNATPWRESTHPLTTTTPSHGESEVNSTAIRTDRLMLSPFDPTDCKPLLDIFQDSDVRRFLLDDQLVDQAWVNDEVSQSQVRFRENSVGIWAISELNRSEDRRLIGFVGFRPFFDPPELQLIYGLVPSAWGKGYATEAAQAAIEFGFANGLDVVVAAADVPNTASIGVMQRLGMQKDRVTDDGEQGTVFYRLDHRG